MIYLGDSPDHRVLSQTWERKFGEAELVLAHLRSVAGSNNASLVVASATTRLCRWTSKACLGCASFPHPYSAARAPTPRRLLAAQC